jgi:DNA-binding NarL/FixJ family response regulator
VREALRAGACGYLPKSAIGTELELALEALERGEAYFSPSIPREEFEYHAGHLADGDHPHARRQREI